MICSSKEWDTCREEKQGCNGCFYDGLSNEEVEECIKEFRNVKPEGLKELDDYTLKLFKGIVQIIDEREELRKQRDYYKREYSLYNKIIEEVLKILTKKDKGE